MARYMLLQSYRGGAGCDAPMSEWAPADIEAHIRFQQPIEVRQVMGPPVDL
jgi:hypothetical protein